MIRLEISQGRCKMLFKNKYSTSDIKKHYEEADKNFNMKNAKASDKIPDKSVYMTKLFYKLYAVNNKAIEKLKKSKSATHLVEIDSTKGDYSRRKGNIGESAKAMYDWARKIIKENKELQYSLFGAYCDTYDNLFNLKWRSAWKAAYDYKTDNTKSLASSFKMMYWSECYLLETLLIKLSMVSYKMYTGLSAVDAVTEVSYQDSAYMDKVVLPGINLNTLISSAKDPLKMIKDYIAGESGGSIDLSNFLSKEEAQILYAPKNILETVYPVGAIYISVNSINPATLFGFGTWNQIEDRFLLAAGPTYTAGSTGGEAEHTLTELEMPAHDHEFNRHQLWKNEQVPPSTTSTSNGYGISWTTLPIYTDKTIATGGGESHNNMPPYLTVYMWQRIS